MYENFDVEIEEARNDVNRALTNIRTLSAASDWPDNRAARSWQMPSRHQPMDSKRLRPYRVEKNQMLLKIIRVK